MARGALEECVDTLVDHRVLRGGVADLLAGRGEDGVHSAEHQQRQHHRPVFVLLERPPQLVGHLPDECNLVLETNRRHCSLSTWVGTRA